MSEVAPSEKHAAFAREVVALARRHGMDGLTVSFRANFNTMFPTGKPPSPIYSGPVTVTWSEGRHGAKNDIKLRFEGGMTISEAGPCGLSDPSTRDCPNMKEVGGGMDGERYSCAVCGKGYYLDYEEMK